MINFLVNFKNTLFGLVSLLWGIFFLFSAQVSAEAAFSLLYFTYSPLFLGILCVTVGITHITSRFISNPLFTAAANILLAFVYLIVLLSHLYASFYALAWIAFAAIVLNHVINAYLIIKSK